MKVKVEDTRTFQVTFALRGLVIADEDLDLSLKTGLRNWGLGFAILRFRVRTLNRQEIADPMPHSSLLPLRPKKTAKKHNPQPPCESRKLGGLQKVCNPRLGAAIGRIFGIHKPDRI